MDPLSRLMMEFMKDKKTALSAMFENLAKTQSYILGLNKFLDNIDNAEMSEENIRKKFKTLMKVIRDQNSMLTKLLLINIVYMQGDRFDSDVAKVLLKMGHGDEALQQMFKNKMDGR
ncbi:MAG: hypothetical protein R3250_05530 [Melioribacteraceae bacterium]|nr:hypothetical protein [Melioribacteraceae bacterium]